MAKQSCVVTKRRWLPAAAPNTAALPTMAQATPQAGVPHAASDMASVRVHDALHAGAARIRLRMAPPGCGNPCEDIITPLRVPGAL